MLAVSVKGAGVILNYVSESGALFMRHLSAIHAGARLRCTVSVGGMLSVCRVRESRVRNKVVSSIIPRVAAVIGLTMRGVLGGGILIIKTKVGAKLGVQVSGPTRLKDSLIISSITTVTRCPTPLLVFSLKATGAIYIVSGGGGCVKNVVCPKVKISLSSLATRTSRLNKVDVRTPRRVVKGGAARYVGDNLVCDDTTTVSKVVSHLRRRLNKRTAIVTANKLTGGVIPRYEERVVLSSSLLLGKLTVVCGGGHGWGVARVGVWVGFRCGLGGQGMGRFGFVFCFPIFVCVCWQRVFVKGLFSCGVLWGVVLGLRFIAALSVSQFVEEYSGAFSASWADVFISCRVLDIGTFSSGGIYASSAVLGGNAFFSYASASSGAILGDSFSRASIKGGEKYGLTTFRVLYQTEIVYAYVGQPIVVRRVYYFLRVSRVRIYLVVTIGI